VNRIRELDDPFNTKLLGQLLNKDNNIKIADS